jgi:micrococcal nuclease
MPRRPPPFVACAALIVLGACATPPPDPQAAGTATVISIIDGDTVVLELGSSRERVRLLGIDTPETDHPTRPVECFGAEATQRLTELIPPGTPLRVERDIEARDHYGRLLLYLHRAGDDLFVNRDLVASGHATSLHVEPNGAHRAALAAAEAEARREGRGLWATCGGPGVPVDPLAASADPLQGAPTTTTTR